MFLNNLEKGELNDYTFYAHNLGRFYSIFILKSLSLNDKFKLTLIWKDNSILSITITYKNVKIKLLDSIQLINGSLDNILKSFNCTIQKGHFPYNFVNKDNLFYVGTKPSQDLYKNISDKEYRSITDINWNIKKETLIYLKADVEGLLEALLKFSKNIFDKYQLNITKSKTLPSLALAAYTSNYIPKNLSSKFKMIKGDIEREIIISYFEGNVEVFINKVEKSYLYDMNSQYPAAMLNDMPVGDPVLSLETDFDNIFGFVYGEITCPNEKNLLVPFIQYRDPDKNLNTCPRGKFKRLIFFWGNEICSKIRILYKNRI